MLMTRRFVLQNVCTYSKIITIMFLLQKYSEWEALRDAKLEQYLIELDKINRLQTIQVQKDELAKKEQLLYYFDNEEEIKLIVEKKTATLRKRAEGVEKRKKSSSIIEDVYVPPEVKKRETIKD